MNNLKPPLKLYTQADLLKILREEIVHVLRKYNLTHEEISVIIKTLKNKYGNSNNPKAN